MTGFYLSLDSTWNATDTPLTQRPVPALAAGGVNAANTPVTIPSTTTPGKYYLIAKADNAGSVTESNEGNNTRSKQLNVGADLTVPSVVAPATSGAGKSVTVTDSVKNAGVDPTAATTAWVYLSTDINVDASDVPLTSHPVDALAGDATDSTSFSVVIPSTTATGYYYILVDVDREQAIVEFAETNNVGRSGLVRIGPDLTVTSLSAPATGVAGGTVLVTETTANTGAGDAPASVVNFYLSTNSTFEPADTPLGSRPAPALAAGLTSNASTSLTLPAGLAAGTYYVIAKADGPGELVETLENNNTRFLAIKISLP
jgi:subtilase family serine protease